jgi:hypothetical protein
MTPGARAVAGSASANPCIITLAPPGSVPESMHMGASSDLIMPGCTVEVGGVLDMQSSAYITADGTSVVGDCTDTGGGCTHVANMSANTGIPPTDPLSSLTFPANPGSCTSAGPLPGGGTPSVLTPGCYSYIDASATGINLTLQPGLYYFTGAFNIGHNALINGSGLLFAFAGTAGPGPCTPAATAGCMMVGNNAEMHLSAQTSGPYNGILMFQEPSNQTDLSLTGNGPIYDLSGAMYFPTAHVNFRNGISTTNDCTLIVAYTLDIDHGNGALDNTCSAYGGSPILTVALAE